MATYIILLLIAAAVLGVAGLVVAALVLHGLKMRRLCEHGVEATAIVERNELRGTKTKRRELTYRYKDAAGTSHPGFYSVSATKELAGLAIGSPLPIIYSSVNPAESAPKFLTDLVRPAVMRRNGD